MKTLLQIQDEIAINRGYNSIDHVLSLCGSRVTHKVCCEAAEIYAEEFKPKWISVDERLPELHIDDDGFSKSVLICDEEYIDVGHYDYKNRVFIQYGEFLNSLNVTHWMPLPRKP